MDMRRVSVGNEQPSGLPDRSWVTAAKSRDWLKTMKPWIAGFGGVGERRPFSVPTTTEWELRAPRNFKFFLTNYVILAVVGLFILLLLHAGLILWGTLLGLGWVAAKQFLINPDGTVHPKLAQLQLSAQHISLIFACCFVVIILIVVGLDLFAVIGISMSIVIVHATLRTPSNEDWSTGLYGGDSGAIPLNTGAAYLHSSATDTPIV